MLDMNESNIYLLSDNVFLQKIIELDKYWVFKIDSGEHYSLNETSFWILEHLTGERPIKDILKDFLDNFDADKKQGEHDFCEIAGKFLSEGLIKRREE